MGKGKVLIIGVGGQDGSYLADILTSDGYEVHGIYRHSSVDNLVRIKHLLPYSSTAENPLILHKGDALGFESIVRVINSVQPEHIYNEADQDNVGWSYEAPNYTHMITNHFPVMLMDFLENYYSKPETVKLFQPLSATMFAGTGVPQNELAEMNPVSPYAKAKHYVHQKIQNNRSGRLRVFGAILYNHDSPRRGEDYLLQNICRQAINVKQGKSDAIYLGDLKAVVDIGYAKEYMKCATKIMQLPDADTFVIGTGVGTSVEVLALYALQSVLGTSDGIGNLVRTNTDYVPVTPFVTLIADCSKLHQAISDKPIITATKVIDKILFAKVSGLEVIEETTK